MGKDRAPDQVGGMTCSGLKGGLRGTGHKDYLYSKQVQRDDYELRHEQSEVQQALDLYIEAVDVTGDQREGFEPGK